MLLITLPASYLVEVGLSAVSQIPLALDITERGDISLMLTKIEPNIQDLISKH